MTLHRHSFGLSEMVLMQTLLFGSKGCMNHDTDATGTDDCADI